MLNLKFKKIYAVVCVGAVVLASCSAPLSEQSTLEKKAALDAVQNYLSDGNCEAAIKIIEPIYNSPQTDNEVRLARASANACYAGLNFIDVTLSLTTGGSLSGSGFWKLLAKTFPKPEFPLPDARVDSAFKAIDALYATIVPGVVIPEAYKVNNDYEAQGKSYNIGSLLKNQRTADSNLYLVYTAMAAIGGLENKYSGTIKATGTKTFPLGYKNYATDGWQKVANMDEEGCAFAGSILTMMDALDASTKLLGKAQGALSKVSEMSSYIDTACELGCQGIAPPTYPGTGTGCSGIPSGACKPCPFELRNRKSCTNKTDNRAGCAAAGIAYFVNNDPDFGWPGP